MNDAVTIAVRDPTAADEAAWRHLWDAYNHFYQAAVAPAVTQATWTRILDPASPVFARLATSAAPGAPVIGFAVCVLHEGTWVQTPICYLEDLFVDPARRSRGIGRALIDDLVALCRARGWARLYWHTHTDNAPARHLYDRYIPADEFVRYRLIFD